MSTTVSARATAAAPAGRRGRPRGLGRAVLALLAAAVFGIPLYLAVVNALKTNEQIRSAPAALPAPLTLDNITNVFTSPTSTFLANLVHSVLIAVPSVVGVILLGSMLGYYLGRTDGWAPRLLQSLLLIGLSLPFQVLLLPLSLILQTLHLQGNYVGLILFNVAYYVPFSAFVYARFMKTVPRELDEAAAIDGAGPLRTFATIIVPLLRPTTASVMIFVGVWVWNDFLNPLILLGPSGGSTVTTGIYLAIGQFNTDFGTMFALTLLAALPVLAFFLVLQDRFVAGLTSGATKG